VTGREQEIAQQQERIRALEQELSRLRKDSRAPHKAPASGSPASRTGRLRTVSVPDYPDLP
jgi:hypothetical protein